MGNRRLNNWRGSLRAFSFVLLIVAALAPLSEAPHRIVMLLASGGLLVYLIADSPASRREAARFLIPLAALTLLAWLVSIDPRWMLFGTLGVYAGACLWGVFRREHAEYLADRDGLQ